MKNRLEIAKELLRDDGVIFVQCDDNEQAYLKVLMDEIFGRENFVNCIAVKMNESKGLKNSHIEKRLPKNKEYILVYGKSADNINLKSIAVKKDEIAVKKYAKYYNKYIPNINEPCEKWAIKNFDSNLDKMQFADKLIYLVKPDNEIHIDIPPNSFGKIINTKGKTNYYYNDSGKILKVLILSENLTYFLGDLWLNISTININKESGVETLTNAQKPEILLKQILELTTNKGDLVMDFFAGSGTTLAVAHKMKRRYIGIEQMEYIESITKERLKKVIDGEQGGISKAVNWQGGGNLIYCELASLNAKFIEKIENSSDENELNQIYENLQKLAFIDYRVDIENLKGAEFKSLDFIEKKRILKKCLDRNMDYIPYADMDDSEYKIDEQTRILNDIFYKGGNDE